MKLAALYCRVSTKEQSEEGTSLATQTEACRRWCEAHGYAVDLEVQEDASGSTLQRPGLDRVRDWAAQPTPSDTPRAVVFYKLDRLSRDTADTLLLLKEFKRLSVAVESATVRIEDTPEGRMLTTMLAAFAELEREQIRERTRRGKERRAREGVLLNSRFAPYGYSQDYENDTLLVNEEQAAIIRLMFDWYVNEGLSGWKIARRLNEQAVPTARGAAHWEHGTVLKMLANETYAGLWHYNKRRDTPNPANRSGVSVTRRSRDEWIPVPVPPIIARSLYAQAQEKRRRSSELSPRNTRYPYLLRGLLYCSLCGSRCACGFFGRLHPYYRCNRTLREGTATDKSCLALGVRADKADEAVWGEIARQMTAKHLPPIKAAHALPADVSRLRKEASPQGELERLERAASQRKHDADKLLDYLMAGDITRQQYRVRLDRLTKEDEAANARREVLEQAQAAQTIQAEQWENMSRLAEKLGPRIATVPWEERRAFVEMVGWLRLSTDGETVWIRGLPEEAALKIPNRKKRRRKV